MKRYTETQKKKILATLEAAPKGKLMEAVKKSKVSYATLTKWKKNAGIGNASKATKPAINKGVVSKLFKLRGEMLKSGAKFDNLLKQL